MLNKDNQPETHLSLWKYVTDDAAKIKDRMWTMASWLFTLQAGLLAFAGKYLSTDGNSHLKIDNHILVIITAVIGIVLSGFTLFMIQQYGEHIRGMWNRADLVRREIDGLSDIWFVNEKKRIVEDKNATADSSLPAVAKRLIYLSLCFMAAFIVLLCITVL